MRREIVPVDMVSEQKVIFGILSYRQLLYIFAGITVAYNMLGIFELPIFSIGVRLIIFVILFSPIGFLVFVFAFWKLDKYDMYWDQYLLNKIRYRAKKANLIFRHGR